MNTILEQKLRDLIGEAERQAAPAMCAALDMLLGAYLSGKQNEFAKHCCQMSPIKITGMAINTSDNSECSWSDAGTDPYIH